MNNVNTIDINNFNGMAQAMGMNADLTTKKATLQLARLKLQHSPIMGEVEVKGKKTQAAIVNGGSYKIEDVANDATFYSEDVTIRPYVQRFMYKKFDNSSGRAFYVKTVMADNLNTDLKDNAGGFNCGKPAGWIKDYNALPENTKKLLKSIKRVRVFIGTLSAKNVLAQDGSELEDVVDLPFIWEIDNRDAFKIMGEPISKIGSLKHLPVQYEIALGSTERKGNIGTFYLPSGTLGKDVHEVTDEVQERFGDFMQWIENYNVYVFGAWKDKAKPAELSKEDAELVEDFVKVDKTLDDEIPF
tara:strand:- start:6215 stop:7117 length:903 start_codon:yes stop_codon:yes gene_type:complete